MSNIAHQVNDLLIKASLVKSERVMLVSERTREDDTFALCWDELKYGLDCVATFYIEHSPGQVIRFNQSDLYDWVRSEEDINGLFSYYAYFRVKDLNPERDFLTAYFSYTLHLDGSGIRWWAYE